ncbi:hypothetical protein LCGC14_0971960 [marine sediment metagenome]|uniref:Uncharacterized protein n=1 Tax=marine sediment metagenome TaxID=412755 RepID=A0A0F9QUJ8_9ZZZZ
MDSLLWWARVWVDERGLRHTIIYDCGTEELTEEWHPVSDEVGDGQS